MLTSKGANLVTLLLLKLPETTFHLTDLEKALPVKLHMAVLVKMCQ